MLFHFCILQWLAYSLSSSTCQHILGPLWCSVCNWMSRQKMIDSSGAIRNGNVFVGRRCEVERLKDQQLNAFSVYLRVTFARKFRPFLKIIHLLSRPFFEWQCEEYPSAGCKLIAKYLRLVWESKATIIDWRNISETFSHPFCGGRDKKGFSFDSQQMLISPLYFQVTKRLCEKDSSRWEIPSTSPVHWTTKKMREKYSWKINSPPPQIQPLKFSF